jgi:DNA-binding GntR family transcriptional regulator
VVAEPTVRIDRTSPVPLYFQVAQQLQAAIESGALPPGTKLENETRLADRFGLSRPTLRQAVQYLVQQGMLVRKRGIGTQVIAGHVRRSVELTSLHDDLSAAGRRPATEVLALETVRAGDDVARALDLAPGTRVVRIRRLRSTGDEPLALMTNHFPQDLVPFAHEPLTKEGLATHGLYELLREAGIRLRVARQAIGAVNAGPADARLLHEPPGAALLTMERVAYDDEGRPVEHGSHLYRASRYSFALSVVERH